MFINWWNTWFLRKFRGLFSRRVFRTWRTKPYRAPRNYFDSAIPTESVSDRQERIAGFDQQLLSAAHVALIGAGMNGEVAEGLVRKGVGTLTLVDFDEVSWTNLNRQFFFSNQVGQMKTDALATNLAAHATSGTTIHSIPLRLGAALDSGMLNLEEVDVLVVAVDNTETRIEASTAARHLCPVIFTAVDLAGEAASVAVQEPGGPCYGCIVPQGLTPWTLPCAAPSIKDTNKLAAGAVLFAIDTLLMPNRKRRWNYHEFHMAGVVPSWSQQFPLRADCPLCRGSGN